MKFRIVSSRFVMGFCCFFMVGWVMAQGSERGRSLGAQEVIEPGWFKQSFLEIAEDVAEAQEENKQVLLFMFLEGCPYCAQMVRDNFQDASEDGFLRQHFEVIALNIKGDREVAFDEALTVSEKELAQMLKVRATPTMIFLDEASQPVLRLDGYRSPIQFDLALQFVEEKAYQNTDLATFMETRQNAEFYTFREHPLYQALRDLSQIPDKPLALVFEDSACDACDSQYERLLQRPDILEVLENFTVVRLDARSDQTIIAPDGTNSSPRQLAAQLGLSYKPSWILYDKGREILRIETMLHSFHFRERLRYVGERAYLQYPNYGEYADIRTETVLKSGQDIDFSK